MTLPEHRRRVCRRACVLALLLVALAVRAQQPRPDEPGGSTLGVPDVVITGADAIIIVPPLPILPGGGIPVPPFDLTPAPFRPSPVGCEPAALAAPAPEPVCIELAALAERLPFFLARGDPPRPVMGALGIRYPAQNHGGKQ